MFIVIYTYIHMHIYIYIYTHTVVHGVAGDGGVQDLRGWSESSCIYTYMCVYMYLSLST